MTKNGELARATCFQESAEEGNADSIEGRLNRCFPSYFQALSKNQKSPCNGSPTMLQYYQRWDGPAFLSANFLLAQTA